MLTCDVKNGNEFVRIYLSGDRFFDHRFSEIMICNFTSHMEVISFSNLDNFRLASDNPTDLPEDPNNGERQ
jgi:hypothetical protein